MLKVKERTSWIFKLERSNYELNLNEVMAYARKWLKQNKQFTATETGIYLNALALTLYHKFEQTGDTRIPMTLTALMNAFDKHWSPRIEELNKMSLTEKF